MNKAHAKSIQAVHRPVQRLPPLDALRGFEAAARLLSFTQAAQALSVTQSAISRQIKTLEAAIGVALFTRFNRRLALTEAGEALYRTAARALAEITATVESLRGPQTRVVTVTTSLSFASLWLVPRLSGFRARHVRSTCASPPTTASSRWNASASTARSAFASRTPRHAMHSR